MSRRWSISADRLFRKCNRQYFYRQIAASHGRKDPFRRHLFVLKQLMTLDLWRGKVIHQGIEKFVASVLKLRQRIPWNQVVARMRNITN